jgi:DNA repair protein RadD
VWPAGFNPDAATAEERKAAIAAGPKQDCLILDFAGNCRRHGPVDAIEIKPKKAKQDPDDKDDIEVKVTEATVRGKECPACNAIVGVLAARCQHCDHEFPIEVKHEPVADSNTPILASERAKIVSEIPVMSWSATKHEKPGKPASMRVTYLAGVVAQNEWVFFEGRGRQWDDAAKWWFQHGGKQPFPSTVDDAIARFRAREVRRPATIKTRPSPANPKYNDIVGRTFPKVTP